MNEKKDLWHTDAFYHSNGWKKGTNVAGAFDW